MNNKIFYVFFFAFQPENYRPEKKEKKNENFYDGEKKGNERFVLLKPFVKKRKLYPLVSKNRKFKSKSQKEKW